MITPPQETRRSFLKKSAVATVAFASADFTAFAAGSSKESLASNKTDSGNALPWYRRALRWGQTNITEIDPERYDIAWWRQYWKRTQIQGVIFNAGGIEPLPWQTDTCIGEWHYKRSIFDQHRYKTALQVVQMLIDIVSKNGNLMLSVPLPGNGLPDDDEMKVLDGLAWWIAPNGEGIYGYTPADIRFTTKGDTLYAFLMGWPGENPTVIKALATNSRSSKNRRLPRSPCSDTMGRWIGSRTKTV